MSCDYTTVGHVTADVMADGSRRPGGGAFYSALQASRLGWRARIVTRGAVADIEQLLAPYGAEFELEVQSAPSTTALATSPEPRGRGLRRQRMLAWAGAMDEPTVDTRVLHVAPVARETGARWRGRADFVGLTPQGLVRTWASLGAPVLARALDGALVPERCDAVVISSAERDSCAALLREAEAGGGSQRGPLVAVTDADGPTQLLLGGGDSAFVPVPRVAQARDDLGAGDVFAAAFFVALAEGSTPQRAATFASAAAAVRIAGEGPSAIGDRAAILARVDAVA
ncbi:MAG TPA: PfkB family carbohydrate kinase [Solirubrobacteraceae bacterium]|nr:PfkB family carbohydrate kinase [Solirubrobacteraceae bacterium]